MQQPAPAYGGDEPYVFVSYSHQDEALVYREIRWLQDQGFKVWYDTQIQAGSEWSDALANAISGCSQFLYFITPNSVGSENCRRELNHALEEDRSVLAVHLLETGVPPGIRLNLNNRQAILKYRLKPEQYRSSLLGALSIEARGAAPLNAASSSSNRSLQLVSAIAAATLLIAVAAVSLLSGTSVDDSSLSELPGPSEAPLMAIAVLPFDDLSPDGDSAWLANGMAEDLIEALGRIEGLRVPARHSTAVLKQIGADRDAVGDRLAVGSLVQGSIRRIGEELSVVAHWIRVSDGARLWSARFDRRWGDIIAIQREIAAGIAEAIRTELGIRDAPPSLLADRYATSDVRAWEMLKRAAPLIDTLVPANLEEAKELLLLATKYDSEYVSAHALLAVLEYLRDLTRGIERFKSVLQMDPSNALALQFLAYDSAMRFWDYETAEQLLQRIPDQEKTTPVLEVEFHLLANTSQLERALRVAERAARLDPMSARANCMVGWAHHWMGNWEAAVEPYEQALAVQEITEQFGAACQWNLASIYHRLGRDAEVLPLVLRNVESARDVEAIQEGWENGGWEGMALAHAEVVVPRLNCTSYAFAGASNKMYECLDADMDSTRLASPAQNLTETFRRQLLAQIVVSDAFATYREEPRFQDIVRRIMERIQSAAGTYEHKINSQFAL